MHFIIHANIQRVIYSRFFIASMVFEKTQDHHNTKMKMLLRNDCILTNQKILTNTGLLQKGSSILLCRDLMAVSVRLVSSSQMRTVFADMQPMDIVEAKTDQTCQMTMNQAMRQSLMVTILRMMATCDDTPSLGVENGRGDFETIPVEK